MDRETPLSFVARPARRVFVVAALVAVPAHAVADGVADAGPIEPGAPDVVEVEVEPSSPWRFAPTGYVRLGFEHLTQDPSYRFVGRNDGFYMANARLGLDGEAPDHGFSFRISVDGAVDTEPELNQPRAEYDVRLKDAYLAWEYEFFRIQSGQFRPPTSAESLRSTGDLLFIERSLGENGVAAGTGLEMAGLEVDRQVGIQGEVGGEFDFGLNGRVALMGASGNGANEYRNDNDKYALYARGEVGYSLPGDEPEDDREQLVTVGVSFFQNVRTDGVQPNLFEEKDLGLTIDGAITWEGLEVSGALTRITTTFRTDGSPENTARAWHAQAGYEIDATYLRITPAYRVATYEPFLDYDESEGGVDLDTFGLLYHTFGLRIAHPMENLGIAGHLEYTMTGEDESRDLDNDAIKALVQVTF